MEGNLEATFSKIKRVEQEVRQVIIGQTNVLQQMMIAILSGGHALLEGVPGTAKTLAVRALAAALSCDSKRIQFTPDLMPSDIVGTNVFSLKTSEFQLRPGPLFSDFILADEINRAPAKTQSALLEGMSERHATIDGTRHELSPIFTVFATQNPIEFEGTYPLPEAQQDRFLLKIRVDYPEEGAERVLLEKIDQGQAPDSSAISQIQPVLTLPELLEARQSLSEIHTDDGIRNYILQIVRATRENDQVLLGSGPRGSIFLLQACKAHAMMRERDFVTPEDVVALVEPVLGHRLTLTAEAEIEGATGREVLQSILDQVDVPR